jgi:nucleoid-associated protein EbfC
VASRADPFAIRHSPFAHNRGHAMRDIMGIMKQAQAMQQKMQAAQEELDRIEVEGGSGGGLVKVTMSAKGQLKAVSIDPSLMNPDEKEILEDLILAAVNDARTKAERATQERMEEVTKGLPLPPGLKLF